MNLKGLLKYLCRPLFIITEEITIKANNDGITILKHLSIDIIIAEEISDEYINVNTVKNRITNEKNISLILFISFLPIKVYKSINYNIFIYRR